jgi:hypothetical protein
VDFLTKGWRTRPRTVGIRPDFKEEQKWVAYRWSTRLFVEPIVRAAEIPKETAASLALAASLLRLGQNPTQQIAGFQGRMKQSGLLTPVGVPSVGLFNLHKEALNLRKIIYNCFSCQSILEGFLMHLHTRS